MTDKLYYCRESEKLWTLEELKRFYETEADPWPYGFDSWLNNCLYQNNGTLEEIRPVSKIGNTTIWNVRTDLE